ncbi:MAG: sugar ABC transporter permease, partial [Corallococcus sp.]|nr:sugar ABC transporter permease [Corallococcus sp.]
MAKTNKPAAPSEVTNDLEQTAVQTEVVQEEVAQDSTESKSTFKDKLADFGGKTKNFFVGVGVKTKGLFNKVFKKDAKEETKEDAAATTEALPEVVSTGSVADTAQSDAAATVVQPSLMDQELPFSVRAKRFMKSQSGWLFVLPALILMCVFTFWPIISAFINAFKQNLNALNGAYDGWGFENFIRVLKSDTGTGGASFVQCLVNTMVLTFISVPLSTLLALLISVALNSIKAVQKAYQTILFLPYLTNALAMGAVFATFFTIIGTKSHTDTVGIVNLFLGLFGVEPINWVGIGSPTWQIGSLNIPWAKYIVAIVYEVWAGLPFKILILFSALQSVNKQYYDAAKIDGASRSTVLWKITTPMISPMISYLLVTGIMGGMKQYSSIVGLFGEQMGIDYDMGTMVGYI